MSAIILSGITLSPSMQWRERYSYSPVAQSMKLTLGGVPVIFSGALERGRPITIESWQNGAANYGALRRSVGDQVLVLSRTPGAIYVLEFNAIEYQVIFRHHEPPAVTITPIYPRTADDDDDYVRAEIRLMTI